MLPVRIASAVVGIPLVLIAAFSGGTWYAVFLWFVAILGMRELFSLYKPGLFFVYAGYPAVTALIIAVHLQQGGLVIGVLAFYFLASSIFSLVYFNHLSLEESSLSLWGIIYVGGLLSYLLAIRNLPGGLLFTLILFITVWINDSLAYLCGVRWGKRKLAPQISPHKSVEGALAGFLGAVAIFLLFALIRGDMLPFNMILSFGLVLLTVIFAQTGDLVESALKRKLNVKDTGSLIPGHGGILDRFDSVMFAAPVIYYYLVFCLKTWS